MSFDSRSFSSDSWGASWGLTWEANQVLEEMLGGGGPDASDNSRGKARSYYQETEADLEHVERKAEHGRRMYKEGEPAEVVEPVVEQAPPTQVDPGIDPARETPDLFSFAPVLAEASEQLAEASQVIEKIQQQIEATRRKRAEEEALLVMLLS